MAEVALMTTCHGAVPIVLVHEVLGVASGLAALRPSIEALPIIFGEPWLALTVHSFGTKVIVSRSFVLHLEAIDGADSTGFLVSFS